jgi:hypothetical protein
VREEEGEGREVRGRERCEVYREVRYGKRVRIERGREI